MPETFPSTDAAPAAVEPTNFDLAQTLRRLETRLEVVARPYEEALANRLFTEARDRLRRYGLTALAILLPALGYMGWSNWKEVESKIDTVVQKHVTETADARVGEALKPKLAEAGKLVQDAAAKMEQVTQASTAKSTWIGNYGEAIDLKTQYLLEDLRTQLTAELTSVRRQADANTQRLVEEFNQRLEALVNGAAPQSLAKIALPPPFLPKVEPPPSGMNSGWVHYAQRADGKWKPVGFTNLIDRGAEEPAVGDRVKSTARINAYDGKMNYNDDSAWSMAALKGVLEKGTIVTVREVDEQLRAGRPTHCWVRFENSTRPLSSPQAPEPEPDAAPVQP